MVAAVLGTLLFFPLYLAAREPFRRLPLHIDTGFYVSNHTVATRRLAFAKGWNAHFAGCSKVVPEVFYSLIYLRHGPDGYEAASRLYASLINFVTAILVGVLACAVLGFSPTAYLAALVGYGLISSEPQWGGYFECGEWFEVLSDVAAVSLLLWGIGQGSEVLVGAAAFVFVAGACWIKLSGLISGAVLLGGLALLDPGMIVPLVAGTVLAVAVFAAWVQWNGRSLVLLLGPLAGHERAFAQGASAGGLAHRAREKMNRIWVTLRLQPWFVPLIGLGLVLSAPQSWVFWLYFVGCVFAYVAQAADCRYYLIPLLPGLAVVAAGGVGVVLDLGIAGWMLLGGFAACWLAWNPVRARRLEDRRRNAWCWAGGIRPEVAERNLILQQACRELRAKGVSESVLVYGPCNQAYLYLGASYDTPIVAPEFYLDQMVPSWQRSLNERLVAEPPRWILDTGRCFRAKAARSGLGLDYRLKLAGAGLLAYRFDGQKEAVDLETLTFGPVCESELQCELASQPERIGDVESTADGSIILQATATGEALRALLKGIREQGFERLAIYGAGRFTMRHAEVYRKSGLFVAMVLDDRAGPQPARFLDWQSCSPAEADPSDFQAVVISSDRFAKAMLAGVRRRWGDRVPTFIIPGTY